MPEVPAGGPRQDDPNPRPTDAPVRDSADRCGRAHQRAS